jgi:long-chain-fatty-acid--CoA ligase ACSBG
MGYLHQPQLTKEAIDSQGWFYSGDMGRLDKEGYLWVSGRLKEILVTAGGENMAPVPIEDRLKRELPLVSQAVLLGDRLKFISVLLTLKVGT